MNMWKDLSKQEKDAFIEQTIKGDLSGILKTVPENMQLITAKNIYSTMQTYQKTESQLKDIIWLQIQLPQLTKKILDLENKIMTMAEKQGISFRDAIDIIIQRSGKKDNCIPGSVQEHGSDFLYFSGGLSILGAHDYANQKNHEEEKGLNSPGERVYYQGIVLMKQLADLCLSNKNQDLIDPIPRKEVLSQYTPKRKKTE